MNILAPDSWLREYLKTKATPSQIAEYLSLCGPSVEKTEKVGDETVYNIEVTSNRPDAMSVFGIAREAAAILPSFGLAAKLINDPYRSASVQGSTLHTKVEPSKKLKLSVKTDYKLNPRWTSAVFENVRVGPSPTWLRHKLELTGIRSLNTIIDITNYLMRAYGQPAHAFDYDKIGKKNGVPTMILRASRKGEKITTLDGKTHVLSGGDIVIEDGQGRLIDLCGVMGAQNSAIRETTKNVVLFLQTYDPARIRRTSMTLAHRTEAASLFEKGIDAELVMPAFLAGVDLVRKLAGGKPASKIYDLYPNPFMPYLVSVERTKIDAYLGTKLTDKELSAMLAPLGFKVKMSNKRVTVTVPSFRRDVVIDVDIIEEIARIYGYHNIRSQLPAGEPQVGTPDNTLRWEEEVKTRLRDWGYTELYTYSMISEELMTIFNFDTTKAYKIANPLSSEWVYLRPSLWPGVLRVMRENLNVRDTLRLFELSMIYPYRSGALPSETPVLLVTWTGKNFPAAKGLVESLFRLFGVPFPQEKLMSSSLNWYGPTSLELGEFGSVGEVSSEILNAMGIQQPITLLELNMAKLVSRSRPARTYTPIPKFPPSFEDLAFLLPPHTYVGPLITALKATHPLIADVTLLDAYENVRTFHITYLSERKNLTAEDIRPVREKLIRIATEKFGATLKTMQ